MKDLRIGQNLIGTGHPTYIIAELSCNHQQKYEVAVQSIKAIAECGATAVKSQVYTPDTITIKSNKKYFKIGKTDLWDGQTLYNLYRKAYTPWEWIPKLKKLANTLGLDFFASAFDSTSIAFLESINVPAYKVASLEIQDLPLIAKMAETQKPIIISTGVATQKDIYNAINTCRATQNHQIAVLKCSSAYPTPLDEVNLLTIPDMKKRFRVHIGLSDHTLGALAPSIAVTLGATIVEKHFILDKRLGGPDAAFSLDKLEFKDLVQKIRQTEKIVGNVTYRLSNKQKNMKKLGRSLFVVENMHAGEMFTQKNVRSIRPGHGMLPSELPKVLGEYSTKAIEKGTPLNRRLIA
ncbi:MAG: pseudaminic acid synthase [Candidatus Pacebacteria bacterium CG_4_10_14_0_8_um_filter_43_12]|nr:MAG: pseudaminic acid synthase [Candidatus Pacebacteria bacterium CG_4_10_14_0_8_um_filter_43_12]